MPVENRRILKIEVDNLSIRATTRTVDIPFSTFYECRKTIKNKVIKKHIGSPLHIPKSSENILASCLKSMAKWGFPFIKEDCRFFHRK